jgi:cell division protein FtsI/penicillin-binding protein 2
VLRKLKAFILFLNLIGIGASIYYKLYMFTCFTVLLFFYFLYIFLKREEMETTNFFNKRALISSNIILFCFMLIFFRLIQVQIFDSAMYVEKVNNQTMTINKNSGNRGSIYDSNGKSLAFNKSIYDLIIDPSRIYEKPEILKAFEEIAKKSYIKINNKKLLKELDEGYKTKKKYKIIAKNLDEIEKAEIDEILKKYKLNTNEMFYRKNIERTYYKKDIYSDLVGLIGYTATSKDVKTGVFGIEKQYEKYLKEKTVERKNPYTRNRGIRIPTSKDEIRTNLNGRNVYMTIDNDLQFILNDEVKKKFQSSNSDEAYGIIMDPNTGKILATAAYTRKRRALRNPVFQDQFEPGSTFKPIIVASALNEGLIKRNTKFDVMDGTIRKYNHTIKESSRSTKGILTTEEVLKKSSNVGMVLIGDTFTEKIYEEYLRNFGLYDRTGVDFPGEIKPYTTPYKRWDKLKKSTMSFGQGIVVSPIQLATAFSAVINGGILYKPYLVEKVTDDNNVVIRRNLPTPVRQVISPEVSREMRNILENVVRDGTAKKGDVEGYRVGGKTGTAQLSTKGGYLKSDYLASFIGFFPADKPKYVVLVMFMKPKGETVFEKYGGATAAPVFGEIVKRITKNKNILSQDIAKISEIKNFENMKRNNEEVKVEMPDLTGLSPKDVIYIFKNADIDVRIVGKGLVESQKPKAGTSLEGVTSIEVQLK